MTTTRVYRSTDSGAPALSSAKGSFIALMQACLVDGYASKAPAGWARPFAGTNKAGFQNSAVAGGTGCCVRIDNTSSGTGFPAAITAYSSMSDVDTGVNPTKTYYGSGSASGPWMVVADELTCYFTTTHDGTSFRMGGFGDIATLNPADAWRYFVCGTAVSGSNVPGYIAGQDIRTVPESNFTDNGLSMPRAYTGIGSAVEHNVLVPHALGITAGHPGRFVARPSPYSADELAMQAIVVRANMWRGRLRGIYVPMHAVTSEGPGFTKVGQGFGGGGSSVSLLRSGTITASPSAGAQEGGLWVETNLPW